MNNRQKKSGFTIIEVVLVLAIAGLIFLMVFIALPALQRNTRDAQRKSDLGRVKTALTNYMSSNRGNIPDRDTLSNFQSKYLVPTSEYTDPLGDQYTFKYDQSSNGPADIGQIVYANARICGPDGTFASGSTRDYAFLIKLEGQTVPFCLGSQ